MSKSDFLSCKIVTSCSYTDFTMKIENVINTITLALLVVITTSAVWGCKKNTNKSVEGQWLCNGSELNHYYYDTSIRVWTGVDSQWVSSYNFADSTIIISNNIVSIKSSGESKFIVTSMAYDGDWSSLEFDTVSYVGVHGNQREYSVKHVSSKNTMYLIDLSYDESNDKIHVVYEWTVLGPNFHDIGSKISLNGIRN